MPNRSQNRMAELKFRAAQHGWKQLLVTLGVAEHLLNTQAQPCPHCGGDDRFQTWVDNRTGEYRFTCRQCAYTKIGNETGDSIDLIRFITGWDFKTTMNEMRRAIGVVDPSPRPNEAEELAKRKQETLERLERLKTVWVESRPIMGTPAHAYLTNRGIPDSIIETLNDVRYSMVTGVGTRGELLPAMLAAVRSKKGQIITIHRTFLTNTGFKAGINGGKNDKQLMPVVGHKTGAAVRLTPITTTLGVAEGIETALSASILHGVPVWATLDAGGLKGLHVPEGLERLVIFSDKDEGGAGQRAAFELALQHPIISEVIMPSTEFGVDFNDILLRSAS